jgi:hypothetical protein
VRVLITKLRRLLPIRIDVQWGQGYLISGLAPAPARARSDYGAGNGAPEPQPNLAPAPCERIALTPPRDPPPIRRQLVELSDPAMRRAVAAPIHIGPRRAEELQVIERFLAERGATRCPDVATIQQSPLPMLIWDKVKRKWVRPAMAAQEAG